MGGEEAQPEQSGIKVYIAMGSNLGDRWAYLKSAVEGLGELALDGRVEVSSIYETEPWGPIVQGPFLNGVVRMWTALTPYELHSALFQLEERLGRTGREVRWGPREIDLDILLYGDRIVKTLQLEIPHPRMLERRFVLVPLAELEPGAFIPGSGLTVIQALERCPDRGWVRYYGTM